MPMKENGLAKLIEECGEVLQIAGKMIQYPELQHSTYEAHPDGTILRARLMNELADLKAAIMFVEDKLEIDSDQTIFEHMRGKYAVFHKWDKEK